MLIILLSKMKFIAIIATFIAASSAQYLVDPLAGGSVGSYCTCDSECSTGYTCVNNACCANANAPVAHPVVPVLPPVINIDILKSLPPTELNAVVNIVQQHLHKGAATTVIQTSTVTNPVTSTIYTSSMMATATPGASATPSGQQSSQSPVAKAAVALRKRQYVPTPTYNPYVPVQPTAAPVYYPPQQYCTCDTQCASGYSCDLNTHACTLKPSYAACACDTECPSGSVCDQGFCKSTH